MLKTLRAAWVFNAPLCHAVRLSFRIAGRPVPEAVSAHLPKTGRVRVRLPGGGIVRLWSRGDDWVANRLFWHGFAGYEPETTAIWLDRARHAGVVLDVGAHVGYFALLAAAANPHARVLGFEPLRQIHARLRRNIDLNGSQVELVDLAVGDRSGSAAFFHVGHGIPSSSSLSQEFMATTSDVEATEVEVVRLDAFVAAHELGRIDLVKIDTEATEPAVLAGMGQVLARDRPTIVCEVLAGNDVERQLEEILRTHDYEWALLGAEGPIPKTSIVADDRFRNWLFTPKARP